MRSHVQQLSSTNRGFKCHNYCCFRPRCLVATRCVAPKHSRNHSLFSFANAGLLLASVCANLSAATGALGASTEGYQHQHYFKYPETLQFSEEEDSGWRNVHHTRPFDAALTSVINLADTLSQATVEFLDLTAAAQASELTANNGVYGSAPGSESQASKEQQYDSSWLSSSRHQFLTGIADKQQTTQVVGEAAANMSQQQYIGVASRMAQQAQAVAGEAFKLVLLLDSQDKDLDASYRTLLQQIAEAAHSVSAVAADIAAPGEWIVIESDGSNTTQ